jgi:LysR family hydrogen peroxide-inducible transcriptional activator
LSEAHCLGQQIVNFCRHQSCVPTISCHSAQLLTVQQLVALGHGVSLIPQLAVDADRQRQCVYRHLSGAKPTRTLAMVWRKHRHQSRLVKAFMDAIRRRS